MKYILKRFLTFSIIFIMSITMATNANGKENIDFDYEAYLTNKFSKMPKIQPSTYPEHPEHPTMASVKMATRTPTRTQESTNNGSTNHTMASVTMMTTTPQATQSSNSTTSSVSATPKQPTAQQSTTSMASKVSTAQPTTPFKSPSTQDNSKISETQILEELNLISEKSMLIVNIVEAHSESMYKFYALHKGYMDRLSLEDIKLQGMIKVINDFDDSYENLKKFVNDVNTDNSTQVLKDWKEYSLTFIDDYYMAVAAYSFAKNPDAGIEAYSERFNAALKKYTMNIENLK